MNKQVQIELANKQTVDFSLGYKNNSIICDFMDCDFNCIPDSSSESKEINTDSYSQSYIIMNLEKILKRIKKFNCVKSEYFFTMSDAARLVPMNINFPLLDMSFCMYFAAFLFVFGAKEFAVVTPQDRLITRRIP